LFWLKIILYGLKTIVEQKQICNQKLPPPPPTGGGGEPKFRNLRAHPGGGGNFGKKIVFAQKWF